MELTWTNQGSLRGVQNFLSTSTPSIVLVCETFWNKNLSVKFRSYNVINKNRADRQAEV